MAKFKKSICITFICIVLFILSGCYSSNAYPGIREHTVNCVENNEDIILELYNMYNNDVIKGIAIYDNGKTDNGIVIDCNNKKYYIITSKGENADPTDNSLLRACEIFHLLNKNYKAIDINYYSDTQYMEIWFKEGYFDADWGIVCYPPGETLPDPIPDKEKIEEIKDGFYTYVWLNG